MPLSFDRAPSGSGEIFLKRCLISAFAVLAFAASSVAGVGGAASASNATRPNQGAAYTDGRYIVTFADEPVASYEGYEAGFPATRPQPGRKLDPNSPAVQRWQQHLTAKHDAALGQVGASKLYDYTVVNNGVAADLTAEQAADTRRYSRRGRPRAGPLAQPATTTTPEFLGLTAAGGLWSQLGGDTAGRRRHHRRRHRHRRLAREPLVRRRYGHSGAGRLARQVC